MSNRNQVHLWVVMLSMLKMSKIANIFNIHMAGKLKVSAFQNFFRIENSLNIKEVMGKKHVCNILSFFWSLWSIIHIYHHLWHLWHESNYIAFDPLLRYFTSLTSLTWIQIKGNTVQSNGTHVGDVKEITVLRYFTSLNYIVYHNSNYLN